MLEKMRIKKKNWIGKSKKKELLWVTALVFAMMMLCRTTVRAAEAPQISVSDNAWKNGSVSDNAALSSSVSDNSIPLEPSDGNIEDDNSGDNAEEPKEGEEAQIPETNGEEIETEKIKEADKEVVPVQVADSNQLQTLNYKESVLTDWRQIGEALSTLSPESLSNPDTEGKALVLQLQNVSDIPSGIKDSIVSDDSGYTKYLHCNIGYGASLVFNGASDNSGFNGISNTSVTVDSEKRGKKSMAVTVRFISHENLGTVAGLQVNLPQCTKGTKVSVYAETVSMDEDGNVTVGENACIGNTKADENGNVEVLIQSTANYMFVYKAAK